MDAHDRAAIERLFAKLGDFEDRAPTRDPQADAYIERCMARMPGAPYYMAQTIVAQEQALKDAEARIATLEGRAHTRADGCSPPPIERPGPWGAPRGGGFLAGAAQTAMGVAGGMMLGSMLGGLFGGGAEAEELRFDDGGLDDGDFGDFGDL
jgi:hypothetical protein